MIRRKHTSKFKFKVVLEALSERFTIHELGRKNEIHPAQITKWKTQFLKKGEGVFDTKAKGFSGSHVFRFKGTIPLNESLNAAELLSGPYFSTSPNGAADRAHL
jgi:transposase-like protein